jgi:hypothetical protein
LLKCLVAQIALHHLQQCLWRDRLFIPDEKQKNDVIQGAGLVGQIDVTWGQANSTCMPPNQKK